MKTFFPLLLTVSLFFGFSSCTKEKTNTTTTTVKTRTELLTSKVWIYDEYFINYSQSNTLLAYKKGKTNNALNLFLNKVKYNTDGTYQETTENGAIVNGTWKFLNNETQTEVKNASGTFTSNIISLSESNYVWYDQSVDRFGEMTPQQ